MIEYSDPVFINSVFNFEIGYIFWMSIFKTLSISWNGFKLIHSLALFTLLIIFTRKIRIDNFTYSLLLLFFVSRLYFYNTFVSMRQPISIFLFLVATNYLNKRKMVTYYLLVLMAISFHSSAIILLFYPIINKLNLSKKSLKAFGYISFLAFILNLVGIEFIRYFSFVEIIIPTAIGKTKFNSLIYSTYGSKISIIYTLEFFIILYLSIKNYNKFEEENDVWQLEYLFILMFIFTFFRSVASLTRFKDYFILTYPFIISKELNKNRYKNIYIIVIILYFISIYYRYLSNFDNGSLVPYRSYIIDIFK